MWQKIFKLNLILCITSTTLGEVPTKMIASFSQGNVAGFDTNPFVQVGDKLYYFGQEKVSWFRADLICAAKGGSLASPETSKQLVALSNFLINIYPLDRWWWLSGSDLETEGKFSWHGTGKAFDQVDWSAGQPDNAGGNENCVHLWYQKAQNKYQMNDWQCKQAAYYICEKEIPKTISVTFF